MKYPKVGEKNAACRVGVVHCRRRRYPLDQLAGRPATNYIAYPGMGGQQPRARPPAIQSASGYRSRHAGRHSANVTMHCRHELWAHWRRHSIKPTTILEDHDDAWIDLQDELHWVHDGREFLWLSERDGWRHIYRVSRDGTARAANAQARDCRRFRRDRHCRGRHRSPTRFISPRLPRTPRSVISTGSSSTGRGLGASFARRSNGHARLSIVAGCEVGDRSIFGVRHDPHDGFGPTARA